MGDCKEIIIGFTKPARDLAASIVFYYVMNLKTNFPSTLSKSSDLSFNVQIFLTIFIFLSMFDDIMSTVCSNVKMGYSKPIDGSLRMIGLIFGLLVWLPVFAYSYYLIGGDVNETISLGVIAVICLIIGMLARLHYSKNVIY